MASVIYAPDRACRVCGCTSNQACPGGCSWVEDDLCSACDPATLQRFAARRDALHRAIGSLGFAIDTLSQLAADPSILDRACPVLDDEQWLDNAMDPIVRAALGLCEAVGDRPEIHGLAIALADHLDGVDGLPNTAVGDAAGARAGSPQPAA